MNQSVLSDLVALGEGFTIEFKRTGTAGLGREICAFANTTGGTILLGVADDGEVCGVGNHNRLKSEVQSIARSAEPPIAVEIESAGQVLCVRVPAQQSKPYSFGGKFFIREGASSQQMSREEIREFFFKEGLIRFDETPCRSFDLARDLTQENWERFARRAGLPEGLEPVATLENLHLAKAGEMTHAGAWLLADDITRYTLRAGVTCAVLRGATKTHILDRKELTSDLYSIFEDLVIHFTLVGGRVLGSNVSVGQCLTENQLFDESVEDLAYVAGLSTVEAKGEFVEVALEMHFTHLPLVSRSQPALQQRGNQVNMREFLGCQPRVSRRVGDPVAVAGFLQAPVTPPAVGMDQTAWLHTVAHKTHQTRARCVGDMAQTDPPHSAAFQFHRNHNQGFAHKLSPANVLLLAAQVSLVDLDTSAQPFPSQPNHRLPQLLQHQPGRLIAAQTEFTLQTLSAQPCFLGAGQPHCQKPTPQRHPRVVQDGSRSGRGLASAGATEHRASPRRPTLPGRAVRTNESRGPADADQILATGLLAGKPFSELHQMLWKVLAQLPRSSPPTARVQG